MADWERNALKAATTRVVIGVLGLLGMPLLDERLSELLPVFASYVAASIGLLWMIRKGIGGLYRAAGGGVLDIGVTSLLVYILGSTETPLVAAYVAVGVLNAAVLPGKLPLWLAGLAVLSYGSLLTLQALSVIPPSPLASGPAPTLGQAALNTAMLGPFVVTATVVVSIVAKNLRAERRRTRELLAKLSVGRYRLERLIGRGGMGQVWEAEHLITGKRYALKFLSAGAGESNEARRRFIREAQAAAAVDHPNVINVVDIFEHESETPVMVMDLLEGRTLREHLQAVADHRLSAEETADILLPVISAVGTAHAAGIVHRDLKPENVFLSPRANGWDVKVLDFGIAKVDAASTVEDGTALTATGTVLGTPYYMAPEQAFGERNVDHRADVWALGVIAYECLAGCRPLEGDNSGQLLKQLLSGAVTPLRALVPSLPTDLLDLVDGMLTRAANERLADLREAHRVFSELSNVEAPSFGPPGSQLASRSEGRAPQDVSATADTEVA